MDRVVLVGRITLIAGFCEIFRLLPELAGLMAESPSRGYFFMFMGDMVLGCLAVIAGYEVTQRRPWAWHGSVAAWGIFWTNAAVILLWLTPVVVADPSVLFGVAMPRALFYAGSVLVGPYVCWTLRGNLPRRPISQFILLSHLIAGVGIGAASAAWLILSRS